MARGRVKKNDERLEKRRRTRTEFGAVDRGASGRKLETSVSGHTGKNKPPFLSHGPKMPQPFLNHKKSNCRDDVKADQKIIRRFTAGLTRGVRCELAPWSHTTARVAHARAFGGSFASRRVGFVSCHARSFGFVLRGF